MSLKNAAGISAALFCEAACRLERSVGPCISLLPPLLLRSFFCQATAAVEISPPLDPAPEMWLSSSTRDLDAINDLIHSAATSDWNTAHKLSHDAALLNP